MNGSDAAEPDRAAPEDGTDPVVDVRRRASAAGRRADVLAVLRDSASPMSVAEIAQRLGVHLNTVRFHLDHLVAAGRVERASIPPTGRGRPRLVFRVGRGMDPAGPRNYRLLAEIMARGLADAPDAVARVTDAGRDWGRSLVDQRAPAPEAPKDRAVDRLVGLLDELGFAPERRPTTDTVPRIGLRHCPFLDVVQTRGSLICHAHLGLMQGALSQLDGRTTVHRLEPFVEPDLCLAHLSPAGDP